MTEGNTFVQWDIETPGTSPSRIPFSQLGQTSSGDMGK